MPELNRRSFLTHAAGGVAALSVLPEFLSAAPLRRGAAMPVAVIGAGRQGRAIMGELQKMDAVTIAALCDVDNSRLSSGLRRAPGATGYAGHTELLDKAKDIKAVFIATPTHEHKQIALDCMNAGKHVYCEAPLAHTPEDCKAIAAAARANNKSVFAAGLDGRSNPIYKLARTFLVSDAVRTLVSIRGQQNQKTTWRTPAGSPEREKALNWRLDPEVSIGLMGEMGTHDFDVVHWYANDYPKLVHGAGAVRLHQDGRKINDTAQAMLEFPNGVNMLYMSTLGNSYEGNHIVFQGENAAIKLAATAGWMFKEADAPTQGWEVYANRQQFHNDEGITLIADATKLASQGKLKEGVGLPNPPLYYAVADFLKSVLESAPVVCSADEAARATIVGIMAHQSTHQNKPITIDPAMLKMG